MAFAMSGRGQELTRNDMREVPDEVGFPRQAIPAPASAARARVRAAGLPAPALPGGLFLSR